MTRYLIAYLGSAAAMAVLDVIWLRLAVKTLYEPAIGTLLSGQTNVPAAALFYVLYVLGILLFATAPALRGGGVATALAMGGAFGFFTYMTYDLTNMATLRDWPIGLSFVDTAWGCFATGLAATIGKLVSDKLA